MPSITPSDDGGDWIAKEAITQSQILRAAQGRGMQMKLDASALRNLAGARPGDSFSVNYVVDVDGTKFTAVLSAKLDDPHDLFAGHSIVAVLGNLLSQIVEARLTPQEPWLPNDERTP